MSRILDLIFVSKIPFKHFVIIIIIFLPFVYPICGVISIFLFKYWFLKFFDLEMFCCFAKSLFTLILVPSDPLTL